MSSGNSETSAGEYHTQERKKSNLAFAFFCMEKDRAKDMEILYAFCRLMDDIADEEGPTAESKREKLEGWKREVAYIYEGAPNVSPLGLEMRGMIARRNIPQQYLQDIIDGVMRDTFDAEFETFEDIRKYCYGVASAVGLASIYVFGFKNPRTKDFAESLGYALQFTNILRDVVDDMRSHNRVYIPRAELEAFGVRREDLGNPENNPNCKQLFAFLHFRAKHFFNKSRRLMPPEDKRSLAPALIMWAIYEKILDSLKELDFKIPAKPFKISKFGKIRLALNAVKRSKEPEEKGQKFGRALVLGGGIAGMYAATRLAYEGFDVSLLETKAHAGGRAAALDWHGARLDNGSHALMGCYDNFFGFLNLISADRDEFFASANGMDFMFGDGRKFEIKFPQKNASAMSKAFLFLRYAKLDGFSSIGNLKLLAELKFGISLPEENETAAEYLKRMKVGEKAVKNFWEPFCVSALNTELRDANAALMADTLRKCILKGGDSGTLYLPAKAIADSFYPRVKTYVEGCGGTLNFSETAKGFSVEKHTIKGVSTNKRGLVECDYVFSALNLGGLKHILPENSRLKARISQISETDILNVYFTTDRKLMEGDYACLIGSPMHWIFDHTNRIENGDGKTFLYGTTVSASRLDNSKSAVEEMLKSETEKFFGRVEILSVLPSLFKGATISADKKSEAARPHARDALGEYANLFLCGDWIQSELPCTIESAAKSVNDLQL